MEQHQPWQAIIEETLVRGGLSLTELANRVGMSKGQLHALKTGIQKSCVYETGVKLMHQHSLAMRKKARGSK